MSNILRFLRASVQDEAGFGVTEYGTVLAVASVLVVVMIALTHSRLAASMAASAGLVSPQVKSAPSTQTAAAGQLR